MRRTLFITLFALVATSLLGCAGRDLRDLDVEGTARSYYLHVPKDAPDNAPLLLVFHGGGSSSTTQGKNMDRFTGFSDMADREGFLVAYPNSLEGNWNDGRVGHGAEDVADIAFVNAVIDDVAANHRIDLDRVYSTGISNGGFFSQRLACEMSSRIAATYTVAATMPEETRADCAPARAVPVAWAMGTEDPLVAYDGGEVANGRGEAAPMDTAVSDWVNRNGCTEVSESAWEDIDPDDGTTTTEIVHSGCDGGAEVRLLRLDGGGHTWPGGSQYAPKAFIGTVSGDFDASEDAWSWLSRFSLP